MATDNIARGLAINSVQSDEVKRIVKLTQQEYEAISEKDGNALYIIVDEDD